MSLPSDQLGDMSDLLSAIQSDIQRSAKEDERTSGDTGVDVEEPTLPMMPVESAFDPPSVLQKTSAPATTDLLIRKKVDQDDDQQESLLFVEEEPAAHATADVHTDALQADGQAADQDGHTEAEAREPETVATEHNGEHDLKEEYLQDEFLQEEYLEDDDKTAGAEEIASTESATAEDGWSLTTETVTPAADPVDPVASVDPVDPVDTVEPLTLGADLAADHDEHAVEHSDERSVVDPVDHADPADDIDPLDPADPADQADTLAGATDLSFGADTGSDLDTAADTATPVVPIVDPALSLLVPSDATAFAVDAESRAVIGALFGPGSEDRVLEGDVGAATQFLTQNTCPSMLIVDLSTSADPMSELDGLADVCTPGTVVLTLGATNDIGLYRRLRGAGVADYVVKPLSADVLGEAIRGSMEPQLAPGATGAVQGKLICVIGARGGVGATTIATNCATLIADEVGKKVGLVDFDLQFGTVALTLDMETSSGLSEAIANPGRIDSTYIESVSVRAGDRLFVIASEDGIEDAVQATDENVAEFLNHLRNEFEVVVVDVPRHLAARWMRAFANASKLVVVTDLSLSGLRDTGRLLAAAKDVVEPSRMLMIANKVGVDKYGGIEQDEFEDAIERKFDFVVSDDPKAAGAAARAGKPIVQVGKDGKMAANIREICSGLVKKPGGGKPEKAKKKMKLKLPFIGGKEE